MLITTECRGWQNQTLSSSRVMRVTTAATEPWSIMSTTSLCNYTVSQKKTVHFCFCQNFVKFPLTLISFGRLMAMWLKLYGVWMSKLTHVTTLPCQTQDVLNSYIMYYLQHYLTTELAHSKLKYGLFSRVISCHDRSALYAGNMHRVHAHKRLDNDASLASVSPSRKWQHCVLDVLGRCPVETQKNRL